MGATIRKGEGMRIQIGDIEKEHPGRSDEWYRGYRDFYLGVELPGFYTSRSHVSDYDRGWYWGYLDLRSVMLQHGLRPVRF